MQEFYCIAQGKSEKVQTFVLHLERALKVIKQQYPYAMTKEDGHRHLKDCFSLGLNPTLHKALHYLYDKSDLQYSQLVIASRKAETERLKSGMSEVRAKSAVVGADTDSADKKTSSEPLYAAIIQQIAYLMSAVANQTNMNPTKLVDVQDSNQMQMVRFPPIYFRDPSIIEGTRLAGDVGEQDIAGGNAPLPAKEIISLLDPTPQS